MLPIYQQHALQEDEVLSLVAFLQTTAKEGAEQALGPPINLVLFGVGGAMVSSLAVGLVGRRLTAARAEAGR
jgi:hypothetical protein